MCVYIYIYIYLYNTKGDEAEGGGMKQRLFAETFAAVQGNPSQREAPLVERILSSSPPPGPLSGLNGYS